MAYSEEWVSFPAEAESGRTVIVTLREEIDSFRESGKYVFRVDVRWDYPARPDGMPDTESEKLLEEATDGLLAAFKKDPAGILTGIYTGDGARDWVFYTRSLHIFQKIFNRGLEAMEVTLPLLIEAEEDRDWSEYTELRSQLPKEF